MDDERLVELGRHDAKIQALEARMKIVEGKIDTVISILTQAKGGWKTLMWVGGACSALTAGLLKLTGFLHGGH